MGSTAIRPVKGRDYLYYVYYDDDGKKSVYCGLASKFESKNKAIRLEMKYIKNQRKKLAEKIKELEKSLLVK